MVRKQNPPPPPPSATSNRTDVVEPAGDRFAISTGRVGSPQKIVIYGPGKIGKSSLAAMAPDNVFLDVEKGTNNIESVKRVTGLESFSDVRSCLQSNAVEGFGTVTIDSGTRIQEMADTHVCDNVRHEKGHKVDSLDAFGFGKGLQHLFDAYLLFLSDLDRQIRAGRNVVLILHDCINDVPNPFGDDFIRFEPHLQSPKSGKASIRNRVVQWADHVLFLGYDVNTKDGKGRGGGTRTIYSTEMPSHVAGSRTTDVTLPFTGPTDGEIWTHILGGTK